MFMVNKPHPNEDFYKNAELLVVEFLTNKSDLELPFSPSLSNKERSIVHQIAKNMGVTSLSRGVGSERQVIVTKELVFDKVDITLLNEYEFQQKTKKIFAKDFQLPITLTDSPYFQYFIDLYDPLLKTKEKLEWLRTAIDQFGGEVEFEMRRHDICKKIIDSISKHESWKVFTKDGLDKYLIKENHGYGMKYVFNKDSHDKYFVSMDIRSANFQAVRMFDPSIVQNCETWNDYVSLYTNLEYIKKSKMLRQIIFGNLSPKKLRTMMRWITHQAFFKILYNDKLKPQIFSLGDDEIILNATKENIAEIYQAMVEISNETKLDKIVEIQAFRINCLHFQKGFCAKEIFVDPFDITRGFITKLKGISPPFFAMTYRHYLKQDVNKHDLIFAYEGHSVSFDKSIYD